MVLSCTVNRKKETGRYENLKMEKWKLDQVTSYRWVTQQFFNRKKFHAYFCYSWRENKVLHYPDGCLDIGSWLLENIINFVNLSFKFLFFNNYYSIIGGTASNTSYSVSFDIQIPGNYLGCAPFLQPFLGAWISDAGLLVLITEFLRMSHCRDYSLHMRQLSLMFWKDEGDQGWKWKLLHTPFLISANVVLLRSLRGLIDNINWKLKEQG